MESKAVQCTAKMAIKMQGPLRGALQLDTVLGHLHLVVSKLTALEECRLLADVSLKASSKVTPLLATVLQCLSTCDHQAQLLLLLCRIIH